MNNYNSYLSTMGCSDNGILVVDWASANVRAKVQHPTYRKQKKMSIIMDGCKRTLTNSHTTATFAQWSNALAGMLLN